MNVEARANRGQGIEVRAPLDAFPPFAVYVMDVSTINSVQRIGVSSDLSRLHIWVMMAGEKLEEVEKVFERSDQYRLKPQALPIAVHVVSLNQEMTLIFPPMTTILDKSAQK